MPESHTAARMAGIAPFHPWLPDAHAEAPTPVSVLLSGVMIKMAVYALARTVSIFYPTWPELAVFAVGLGTCLNRAQVDESAPGVYPGEVGAVVGRLACVVGATGFDEPSADAGAGLHVHAGGLRDTRFMQSPDAGLYRHQKLVARRAGGRVGVLDRILGVQEAGAPCEPHQRHRPSCFLYVVHVRSPAQRLSPTEMTSDRDCGMLK